MAFGIGARRSDLLLPVSLLAAMVVADILLPPTVVIVGAFAVPVFVASALTTQARTAAVGVAASVLTLASAAWNQDFATVEWWVRVLLTVSFCALAVMLSRIRIKREQALQQMTVIAETVERALLRPLPQTVGPMRFAARYVSATRAALVGGDLYEVADTAYGVRVIVGDVRGKGIDAVQMAATVLAGFRSAAMLQTTLAGIAKDLDTVVTAVAEAEDFVTAVLVEFHDDHSVSVVNCGHHPPLLISATGAAEALDTGDEQPPLGLHPTARVVTSTCLEGDRLLIYTDGLVETRDDHGAFFPLERMVDGLRRGELGQALDQLLARLQDHADQRLSDDVAIVLAEYRPSDLASQAVA
jgi:phosphoserine phosphatase RsbU/P